MARNSPKLSIQWTQLLRLVLFASIVLCVHMQHDRFTQRQLSQAKWSDVLPAINQVLPEATSVSESNSTAFANVADSDGKQIGYVGRTSPIADHILGFSGPTDVLLVFDQQKSLVAAKVLSSRDTRDHVDKVVQDPRFLSSLRGRSREELMDLSDVDAVSGATLTSYAILESIRLRLANAESPEPIASPLTSLKFPRPPRLDDVKLLYSDAATVEPVAGNNLQWKALDATGSVLGNLWRASPTADNNVGYQGPTDLLIAVDVNELVTGIAIGESYDNEPYVGYVRDDKYFRNLFNGRSPAALAALDLGTVEGVSGATMTSQAAARSLQLSAQALVNQQNTSRRQLGSFDAVPPQSEFQPRMLLTLRNLSTIAITCFGIIISLTRLRGRRWLRVVFQCFLIGWLGLMNGDLVSQALLLGWAQSGIPWKNAFGLTFLSIAAFAVPVTAGRNVYCSHLCPHGAVQQLVRNRISWQMKLPTSARRWLSRIPGFLIAWVVAIGMLHLSFSAVDIEPFDAWLWSVAGIGTLAVAVVGLIASLFMPMAYCRFGCPTGALLNYVSHSSGKSLNRRDLAAAMLLIASVVILCFD